MKPTPDLATSDKITWHRYLDFYEPYLTRLDGHAPRLLEFGVLNGASIRHLAERYPQSRITGVDILPAQPTWPVDARIDYARLDQDKPEEIAQLFIDQPGPYDLIIEDGSHIPAHQRNCLLASLPHIRPGGTYILEDLHTSHPSHPSGRRRHRNTVNCYHVLLAFEHLRSIGAPLTDQTVKELHVAPIH